MVKSRKYRAHYRTRRELCDNKARDIFYAFHTEQSINGRFRHVASVQIL